MPTPLNVLMLEDRPEDAKLIRHELRKAGFEPEMQCVDNEAGFTAALNPALDVILTDYSLPQWNGMEALRVVKRTGLDVPVIIVSGSIGEEEAVAAMREGATDYLIKDRLTRLGHAVTNAISERRLGRQRREAEAALAESERFNRATLDALTAHIAVLDANGKILATNRAWRDFAEANAANWTSVSEGVNYLEVCERAAGSSDAIQLLAGIRAVIAGTASAWSFEYPCHSPGEQRWYYCSIRRFAGEGPVRVVVAHENISPMKQAQAALQESESRYRLVFDRNPLPMWVYDASSLAILAANEAAICNYGYKLEELRQLTFRDLHTPEDVPQLLEHLGDGGAAAVRVREARHRKKDGSVFHAEVFSQALLYDGRPAQLAMAADITEKKQIQEKFLHAQRLESLGMLAAGIAHDLNNVLAPIMFAAPLLRDSLTSPRDRRVLDTLMQCATRGTGLVKQILGFAGATTGEFQILQVKHIARDIIGVIEETFPKSIRLESHIPSDLWPVRGDATQIHQVLLNLCVNARDAMPQGGTLRLVATNRVLDGLEAAAIPGARAGTWLVLEVGDTGTGITPEVLAHIWEPFFTTKAPGRGTGLGLPTVRGIIAAHLGFVPIDTQVGHGTTFRVYLPTVESEAGRSATTAPFSVPRGRGQLILVVDDDEAMRYITAEILSANGYRVITAIDGMEAIAVFNVRPDEIALVVSDVDMPNLGGVALARALRQIRPNLPLLAMSGLTREETDDADVNMMHKLAGGFLLKPFKEEILIGAVHRLLAPALPAGSPPPDARPAPSP